MSEICGAVGSCRVGRVKLVRSGDGVSYVGQLQNGKKHCQGTDKYQNGASYVDHLQNGKKLGQGTDKYRNGISYVASFKMAGNMARVPTDKFDI